MAQKPLSFVGKTEEEIGPRFLTFAITLLMFQEYCKEVKGSE